MKIAVFNFSGNTGKTTLVRHLFAPRMPDAELFAIESINAEDIVDPREMHMRGREFGKLYTRLLMADKAIVDVGTSNVEEFDARMAQYDGSHEVFDRYIIPTVMESKQQKDTRATIEALVEKGVGTDRIHVLFNKADKLVALEDGYSQVFDLYRTDACFVLDERAVLYQSDVYSAAAKAGKTISELAATRDLYRQQLADARGDDRLKLSALVADAAMAIAVDRQLDAAFRVLMQ
jgi:hypothetical protein